MTYDKAFPFALVFALSLLAPSLAFARQDVVLPDLAPREVEITGDLTIVFPALRRQPLVGFNPPPPVPDIPASRDPFAEAYKQPSADLPPSPVLPPDPPDVSAIAQRFPVDGVMSLSVGRYLDRRFVADIALRYDRKTSSLLNLEYHGSNGHEPFIGSSANSGFNRLQAGLRSSMRTGKVVLSSDLSGFKHTYSLFGLVADPAAQSVSNPDRDFSGAEATLGVSTLPGARFGANIQVSGGLSSISSDIFDPSLREDPSTSRDETFLQTRASVSIPIQDGYIALTGTGTTSGLDAGSFPGSTVQSAYTEAVVSYLYSRNLNIKAGLAFLGFQSEAQNLADRSRSLSYLSPVAELSYAFSPSVRLYGGNQPVLEAGLQRNAYQQAPFLRDEPLLLPSLTSVDAHVGAEYFSQYVTSKVQVGYKDQPYRRFAFAPSSAINGYSLGYPGLGYDNATVAYGKMDLGVVLSPGLQAGVQAEYRKAELTDLKADVPYLSPLALGGFASASFLGGNALIQVDFKHEGSRYIDVAGSTKTNSITLFGVEGSYFLTPAYGVSVGIRNLGASPEFWQLYPMESSTVYMGAKYRW